MKKVLIVLVFIIFFFCSCNSDKVVKDYWKDYENMKVINIDNVLACGTFYINRNNPIENLTIPLLTDDNNLDYFINEMSIDFQLTNVIGTNIENINFSFEKIFSIYSYKNFTFNEVDLSINVLNDIEQTVHIDEFDFLIGGIHEAKIKVDLDINIVPNYEFFCNESGSILFNNSFYNLTNSQVIEERYSLNPNEKFLFEVHPSSSFLNSKDDTVVIDINKLIAQDNIIFTNLKIGSGVRVNDSDMREFDLDYTITLTKQDIGFQQLKFIFDIECKNSMMYNYYTMILQYRLSYEETDRFLVYNTQLVSLENYVLKEIVDSMDN